MKKSLLLKVSSIISIFIAQLIFFSCSQNRATTILTMWVENREFARYTELFNSTHSDIKVAIVYKDNSAESLQDLHGEPYPDIVEGQWLWTEKLPRHFKNIRSIFGSDFAESSFYPQLLRVGKSGGGQYLLPLSFNISAAVFSTANAHLVTNAYTMQIAEMQNSCAAFQAAKNEATEFVGIAFSPLDNPDFLYLSAKIFGANFQPKRKKIVWNEENLFKSIYFIRNWSTTVNGGTQEESNFAYKYLAMTRPKQLSAGRSAFAFMKSNELFTLSPEQLENLDFRWLSHDGKLPVDDAINMLGLSKKSKHVKEAKLFLRWLLNAETQKRILEKKAVSSIGASNFGIAGGFSSLWEVNEKILPAYNTKLWSNIPQKDLLEVPEKFPPKWYEIRERVVLPYISQACSAENISSVQSLSERMQQWERQNFN